MPNEVWINHTLGCNARVVCWRLVSLLAGAKSPSMITTRTLSLNLRYIFLTCCTASNRLWQQKSARIPEWNRFFKTRKNLVKTQLGFVLVRYPNCLVTIGKTYFAEDTYIRQRFSLRKMKGKNFRPPMTRTQNDLEKSTTRRQMTST